MLNDSKVDGTFPVVPPLILEFGAVGECHDTTKCYGGHAVYLNLDQ